MLMINRSFMIGPGDQSGVRRRPITAATWRPGSDSVVDRFEVPGPWMVQQVQTSSRGVAVSARVLALAATPEVMQWGDRFLAARADHWSLDRYDTTGAMRSAVRLEMARQPVTESRWMRHARATHDALLADRPDADTTGRFERILAQEHADTLPAYQAVRVTPSEMAWVLDYRTADQPGWAATALAPDGRILGRLVEPSGDAPVAFGDDRVAFRTEDEVGIATITVHRLQFP
jgi:hypothetical protein